MNTNKKLVVFDFDGVFVDSLEMWFQINLINNPDLTREQYSLMSCGNFFESFQSDKPIVNFKPHPEYHQHYAQGLSKLPLIDNFVELVTKLVNQHHLVVVSSGSENVIKDFLTERNLVHLFDDVLGYETNKNKTIKLNHLLDRYSLSPNHAVYITDTLGDVLEAHKADIKSIGVLWGLHDREILGRGNPEHIVESPAELLEKVYEVFGKND